MSRSAPRRHWAEDLARAASAYQVAEVIPHCASCAQPCCRLQSLVLELEWKQLKSFWRLDAARPAFDRRLAAGEGPAEIRAANGLYYVHGKACPVYDEVDGSCQVYDRAIKPVGCSDFPVYEDGDCLVADLRCEAVDLAALTGYVARSVGPGARIVQVADEEFPFLVTLSLRASRAQRK